MKKLSTYKGFGIYQATKANENNNYQFDAFLKDTSPKFDSPEWQADNTTEIIDFINYKERRVK